MLKCIVCGAVFEDDVTVCPVCGVGTECFVPFEEQKTEFAKNTTEIFMILGGGIAAVSAAEAIRERNAECGICILTDEEYLPYNRPMLTKSMKTVTPESLAVHDKSWYDERNICVLTGKKVEKILPEKHEILVNGNETYYYDKCIYALGAHCFVPPIAGKDLGGVFAVRGINDVKALSEHIDNAKKAVVIGGGVLGLEAAWSLREVGLENVTVLESADRLMPRQIDAQSSAKLSEICLKNGVDIITNAKIKSICGNDFADGVILDDGVKIPADVVIVSCGIRANTEIAAECGIETGRGVKVDSQCRTNIPDIFACGDCAEYRGVNYALWSQALDMGKVAGACAAGDDMKFEFTSYPVTFNGMNTSLYAVGDCGSRGDVEYVAHQTGDYEKRFYISGRLCGAVVIGDTSKVGDITLEI